MVDHAFGPVSPNPIAMLVLEAKPSSFGQVIFSFKLIFLPQGQHDVSVPDDNDLGMTTVQHKLERRRVGTT